MMYIQERSWGDYTRRSFSNLLIIMKQEDTQELAAALPNAVGESSEQAASPVAPPAQKKSWEECAEKIKAITIKAVKIMTLVAAGVALLELVYVGVLFIL